MIGEAKEDRLQKRFLFTLCQREIGVSNISPTQFQHRPLPQEQIKCRLFERFAFEEPLGPREGFEHFLKDDVILPLAYDILYIFSSHYLVDK
jgi:hypothetical protein